MAEKKREMRFTVPGFEGTLNSLIDLAKKRRVDIERMKISPIVERYSQHLNEVKTLEIDDVGAFFVDISTLLDMKSKSLLSSKKEILPSKDRENETVGDEELKRVKLIYGKLLESKGRFDNVEIARVMRRVNRGARGLMKIDEGDIEGIKEVFQSVWDKLTLSEKVYEIKADKYNVSVKVEEINEICSREGEVNVNALFSKCLSKLELVVVFLAILELYKEGKIEIAQERDRSGNITLKRRI